MKTNSTRALLERQLKELKTSRDEVENTVYILLLIGSLLGGSFLYAALLDTPIGPYIAMHGLAGSTLGLLLIVTFPLACTILVLSSVPRRLKRIAEAQSALIRQRLEQGSLAAVVVDEARWEPVYALMGDEPWLHWSGLRRPQSLPQQIAQSADYWRAALLLEQGTILRLPAAVRSGSLSCRIDNLAALGFSNWMLIIWLGFGLVFLFPLLPVLVPMLLTYIRQRATHITLLEYFLDKAEVGER